VYPAFFIAPAMNPRTVCFCHPIWVMISPSVAPCWRCSIATTWAVLLPSRGPALRSAVAAVLALGAFARAGVVAGSAAQGRDVGRLYANFGYRCGRRELPVRRGTGFRDRLRFLLARIAFVAN
jgi:hypothetical protein